MSLNIDFSALTSCEVMGLDIDRNEHEQLKILQGEAEAYLLSHEWCSGIVKSMFGFGAGRIFAVYFIQIKPSAPDVEEYFWVISGNFPALYFVADTDMPTPGDALSEYLAVMQTWADAAVRQDHDLAAELPPVNAPFTPEFGKMLGKQLEQFIAELMSDDET
ncbi:MAG: hypothetical protein J6W81_07140 [Lentisphaeria bacterium]|nr:hypothetical protein [Lentisphaeria bacterium]